MEQLKQSSTPIERKHSVLLSSCSLSDERKRIRAFLNVTLIIRNVTSKYQKHTKIPKPQGFSHYVTSQFYLQLLTPDQRRRGVHKVRLWASFTPSPIRQADRGDDRKSPLLTSKSKPRQGVLVAYK